MMYLCSQNETIRMKKVLFIILSAMVFTFSSCSQKKTEEKAKVIDTIPMMVMQIQKCSRLYTAEVHVHKIVTHDDQLKLKGSFLKKAFNIEVPGSNRKVAIPMDATLKAYVDFKDFSQKNVSRKGDKIEIILPDPKVMLTSSKIDHDGVKQYVAFTRRNFSDAELSQYEQQGREGMTSPTWTSWRRLDRVPPTPSSQCSRTWDSRRRTSRLPSARNSRWRI